MKNVDSHGGMGFQFSHRKRCMSCYIMGCIILAFQNPPVIPCKLGRCLDSQSGRQAFRIPHVRYAWKTRVIYSIRPMLAIKTYSKDHPPEGLEPLQSLVLEDCQL